MVEFGLVWFGHSWFVCGPVWFGLVKVGVIWLSLIPFRQSTEKRTNKNNYLILINLIFEFVR